MPSYSRQVQEISALTTEEASKLDRQRSAVSQIMRENFGYVKLEGSLSDFYYLQKIIDRQLISKDEESYLQALGVVLGDIMVRNLGLKWVTVDDRYGHSRALQYEDSNNLFFPITMISRRVKMGVPVDIQALYKETELNVKALIYQRSKYRPVPKPKY